MIYSPQTIYKKWNAVELELLNPAVLATVQLQAISHIRKHPYTPSSYTPFPITVARFKTEEESKILAYASTQATICNREDPFVQNTIKVLERDLQKIHSALFDIENIDSPYCEIGLWRRKRLDVLHSDRPAYPKVYAVYAARIGSLPCEVVDGYKIATATEEERSLIADAISSRENKILRERGLMRQVPLGEVTMLISGKNGTLHCSSQVPEGGAYSGFFRSCAALTAG